MKDREPASSVISKWAAANNKYMDESILMICMRLASMPLFGGNEEQLLDPDNSRMVQSIYSSAMSLCAAQANELEKKSVSKHSKEIRRHQRANENDDE